MKRINQFNKKLAEKITKVVGTMWCAYLFAAIALISLPAAIASRDVVVIVGWVAQTFLQLILLSIIMVGQGIQGAKAETHMERTLSHISNDNNRILEELKTLIKN